MKKLFFTLIFSGLMCLFINAQDYSADQHGGRQRAKTQEVENASVSPKVAKPFVQSKHELGFASGYTTGYGFSYRYWPKKHGFQITLMPSVSSEKKNLSAGLIGLYELDAKKWYRFFAYYGGNFNWTENPNNTYFDTTYDDDGMGEYGPLGFFLNLDPPAQEQRTYTVGFGPGLELTPGKHFGINFMTGFRYFYTNYAKSEDVWKVTLSGELALYYRF